MIPPVLFAMPDTAPVPGALPILSVTDAATSFSTLLSGQTLPDTSTEADTAPELPEGEPDLDTVSVALLEMFQPIEAPPTAPAPAPTEALDAAPETDALPAEVVEVVEVVEAEPLPLEPVVLPEPEVSVMPTAEGPAPEGPVRGVSQIEAPPPPAEVAVESGEDPQVQIRPHGLDKLSLRIDEGGDRFDVEIERGVDRSLDIRVVAPPEAIDELSSMESELQRSLEERALRLGSYSAQARDHRPDGSQQPHDGFAGSEGEGGEVDEAEPELPEWSLGLLNIRA